MVVFVPPKLPSLIPLTVFWTDAWLRDHSFWEWLTDMTFHFHRTWALLPFCLELDSAAHQDPPYLASFPRLFGNKPRELPSWKETPPPPPSLWAGASVPSLSGPWAAGGQPVGSKTVIAL